MFLDRKIRIVSLQFSFSNPDIVPPDIPRRDRLTRTAGSPTGVLLFDPTENTSVADLPADLEQAGYELADAFHEERAGETKRRTYRALRFVFSRREHATAPSEERATLLAAARRGLERICKGALWKARAYLNPLRVNGEETEDEYAVSIPLVGRQPLFWPDGRPVSAWQRDERGNKLGDAPIPIRPAASLRVKARE